VVPLVIDAAAQAAGATGRLGDEAQPLPMPASPGKSPGGGGHSINAEAHAIVR
jgi:hypothetical protein